MYSLYNFRHNVTNANKVRLTDASCSGNIVLLHKYVGS